MRYQELLEHCWNMDTRINQAIEENFAHFHSLAADFKDRVEHDEVLENPYSFLFMHVAFVSLSCRFHVACRENSFTIIAWRERC